MQQNILNIILIFNTFCCINFCLANDNLHFENITLEDGLTGNRYNYYIFEDSRGFIWISSMDGLNRFDGKQVKNYRAESGLLSNNIQSDFFEDSEGNIWFTTYEAINCYNQKLDRIDTATIKNENSDYRALHLDIHKNLLWLRAGNNIYEWNIVDKTKKLILSKLPSTVKTFKVATDTNNALKYIAIIIDPDEVWFVSPKNSAENVCIFPDFADLVYLENNKWLFYSNKNTTHIVDADNPDNVQIVRNDQIENVIEAVKYNQESHFIATKNNGLWLYNWKTGKYLKHWTHQPDDQSSMFTNSPRNLYISSTSNYLWMSHRNKGLNYAYLNQNNFHNPLKKLTQEKLDVRAITQTNSGSIWITTKSNGVYVFSKGGSFKHQFDPQFVFSGLKNTIEFENNTCLTNSHKAIYQLSIHEKSVEKLSLDFPPNSFRFRYLTKIFPDRHLVTTTKGIMELEKESNNNLKLKLCDEFSEHQVFKFLQVHQTSNNKLLLPYNANELWFYEAGEDSLKFIAKNDSCNLQFYGFCESRKKEGIIWAGTSKGLRTIDDNNNIKPVFYDNSELANGNVYGIVEDNHGILWITTNRGLWKYNPTEPQKKPIHFEEADGLSGEQFSLYHSSLSASDGTVWLGNNKGLVKFHPDSIKVHKEIPKLHLDDLLINDTKSFKKNIEDNALVLNHNQSTLTFDIKAINLYKNKRNKIHYQLTDYDEEVLKINNGEKIRYTKINPGEYKLNAYAEDANGHKSEMKELLKLIIKPPWWKTMPFYILYILLSALATYSLLKWRENYIIKEQTKKAAVEKLKAQVKFEEETKKREIEKLEAQVKFEEETKKREIEKLEAQAKLEEETKKREIEKLEAQALIEEEAKKAEIANLETNLLEVEMKALRAQMNPHFLFNSLNSIKSLILKKKGKKASTYLTKFSTLLRNILDNSEKKQIVLDKEIESLNLYIELESLRFTNDFKSKIQIDKTIESSFVRIPPLLLQPFVENAIWHGLLPKTSGINKLNINVLAEGDFLIFEIEDNGVGRQASASQQKKPDHKPMGVDITRRRIQLLHQENDIQIIDLGDNEKQALGTKVIIKLYAPE